MSEKYIRQNKNSCLIVKNSKTYAKISSLEDAIFIRDFLIINDWDLKSVPQILKKDENYLILTVFEEKIHMLAKYRQKPDTETIDKLVKKHKRNPNNSRYGLNITKVLETFVINKQIAGDEYIFGYYDLLEDAEFVRNFLMDHNWNVNEFKDIEYDGDNKNYKLIRVIDDKVYVLDSFYSKNIDMKKAYSDFLAKVSKHKYGLENYPHLDLLKDKIHDLEDEWNVKSKDDVWNFNNSPSDALNDIIFTLTPFQKSVYDAIEGNMSFEDIKKALIRFKSKNFENKINKNLDELIDRNLIVKEDDLFRKTNF